MKIDYDQSHVEYGQFLLKKEMTVSPDPKAFQLLTADLYSYKIESTIREILSNHVDTHGRVGNANPIEITLPTEHSPVFITQDWGEGMNEAAIDGATTLFKSTKDTNDVDIGGYGLGCKAPFSYTNHFYFDSVFDNKRYAATAFIDADGTRSTGFTTCGDEVDLPNGTTISIPVNPVDVDSFTIIALIYASLINFTHEIGNTPCRARITNPEVITERIRRKIVNQNFVDARGALRESIHLFNCLVSDEVGHDGLPFRNVESLITVKPREIFVIPDKSSMSNSELVCLQFIPYLIEIDSIKRTWNTADIGRFLLMASPAQISVNLSRESLEYTGRLTAYVTEVKESILTYLRDTIARGSMSDLFTVAMIIRSIHKIPELTPIRESFCAAWKEQFRFFSSNFAISNGSSREAFGINLYAPRSYANWRRMPLSRTTLSHSRLKAANGQVILNDTKATEAQLRNSIPNIVENSTIVIRPVDRAGFGKETIKDIEYDLLKYFEWIENATGLNISLQKTSDLNIKPIRTRAGDGKHGPAESPLSLNKKYIFDINFDSRFAVRRDRPIADRPGVFFTLKDKHLCIDRLGQVIIRLNNSLDRNEWHTNFCRQVIKLAQDDGLQVTASYQSNVEHFLNMKWISADEYIRRNMGRLVPNYRYLHTGSDLTSAQALVEKIVKCPNTALRIADTIATYTVGSRSTPMGEAIASAVDATRIHNLLRRLQIDNATPEITSRMVLDEIASYVADVANKEEFFQRLYEVTFEQPLDWAYGILNKIADEQGKQK